MEDLRTGLIIQKGFVQGSYHQQGPWEACLSFRSPAQGKMGSKDREGCSPQAGQSPDTAQKGPRPPEGALPEGQAPPTLVSERWLISPRFPFSFQLPHPVSPNRELQTQKEHSDTLLFLNFFFSDFLLLFLFALAKISHTVLNNQVMMGISFSFIKMFNGMILMFPC